MTNLRRLVAAFFFVSALCAPALAQKTERAKLVGKRMMCQCGCGQVLIDCNHVGCYSSAEMLKKVDAMVEEGKSDEQILDAFVAEYGQKVLAEPPRTGFGRVAWIMPWVFTFGGLGVVWLVLQRMRTVTPIASPAGGPEAISGDALSRFRAQADQESEE